MKELWYERQAMHGEPMPEGLNFLDARMYQALACLYFRFNQNAISVEDGKREKRILIAKYQEELENEEFNRKWVQHTVQLWKAIEAADNQYRTDRTLEHADLLSDTILGLVKPDFDLKWAEEHSNET